MARGSIRSLAAALAVAFAASGALVTAAPKDREVRFELAVEKADFKTTEDVFARFTVHNDGDRGRPVYLWDTPLQEVENDLFLVTRDGERVAYLGYIAKRGVPTDEDYLHLKPGKSASVVVELSSLYDLSQPGLYTVQYRGLGESNEVSFRLTGEPRKVAAQPAPAPEAATVYRSCSAGQQADLEQALPAAQNYASEANSSLNGPAGARYTTWFGSYTPSRHDTIQNHFQSISSALDNQTITFDCKCKKKYYAYVYPNRPYEIFLCRVFWTAPMTGTDSKAGTIIHETSHFNVVAGTNDWAYGQSACRNLAITDPDRAVDNADSHEYYAENNPPQN
jgi:peptidyl-Lys metalloendopeptidase